MDADRLKEQVRAYLKDLPRQLPLLYLAAVAIGMLFNYFKFTRFGINIFQYASVFDFLVSPFEDPNILLFIIGSMTLFGISLLIDAWWKKKWPLCYRKWTFQRTRKPWYMPLYYPIITLIYIWLAAVYYGWYTEHAVRGQADVTVQYTDNTRLTGQAIGKVGNALFLLRGDTVHVVPMEANIKSLTQPLP